jgi:hypothetical protein
MRLRRGRSNGAKSSLFSSPFAERLFCAPSLHSPWTRGPGSETSTVGSCRQGRSSTRRQCRGRSRLSTSTAPRGIAVVTSLCAPMLPFFFCFRRRARGPEKYTHLNLRKEPRLPRLSAPFLLSTSPPLTILMYEAAISPAGIRNRV